MNLKQIRNEVVDLLRPPPDMTVSEWADAERVLTSEASAETGRWKTSRAEYQRGIMDAFSDPDVQKVVVMFGSQMGKTEIILNICGYHIQHDPSPILIVQPTILMGEAWSKDRFAPMLEATKGLKGLVSDARSRDSGNTIKHKTFPGGHITIAGANSAASLASRPVRIVLLDEVDRYPYSAGTEGSPCDLAIARAENFFNRVIGLFSTPTTKDESVIEDEYEQSDKRRLHVNCKDCNEPQQLKWQNVHWEKDKPETAHMICEHCGSIWSDGDRINAIRTGEWIATAPFKGIAGFKEGKLCSPWVRLAKFVSDFLKAKKDPAKLKVWTNTGLAETWEDKGRTVEADSILNRREAYDKNMIPDDIVLITAGVDIQSDRIEAEAVGWGMDEESWGVDYQIFRGDPTQKEVWEELDEWLLTKFVTENGRKMVIESCCVDRGYLTDYVDRFCGGRKRRRVWATKGVDGQGRPIWPKSSSISKVKRAPWFAVGVDTAKEIIYNRLKLVTDFGPGYMHFPADYDDEYFRQLTAEKLIIKKVKGRKTKLWVPKRERNEALDCRVLAMAAKHGRNIDVNKRADKLLNISESPVEDLEPVEVQAPTRRTLPRRPKRQSGFVQGFK